MLTTVIYCVTFGGDIIVVIGGRCPSFPFSKHVFTICEAGHIPGTYTRGSIIILLITQLRLLFLHLLTLLLPLLLLLLLLLLPLLLQLLITRTTTNI